MAPLKARWPSGRVAVALSGGVDSAMLAVVADRYARGCGADLLLLHVHHGLLP
ncbi:MAG: tRNA(Ile)-lysidine synthetase, partial [Comamonadaceae bacterium]